MARAACGAPEIGVARGLDFISSNVLSVKRMTSVEKASVRLGSPVKMLMLLRSALMGGSTRISPAPMKTAATVRPSTGARK